MSREGQEVQPGSEIDLAIERALESANLRAGGASETSTAFVLEHQEPSAVDAGPDHGAGDGD